MATKAHDSTSTKFNDRQTAIERGHEEQRRPNRSATSSRKLIPCRDAWDCTLRNSSAHCSKYSHPCPFADRCNKKAMESNLTHEPNHVPQCAYDGKCIKMNDPYHRASFWHSNNPDFLKICRDYPRCSDSSYEHRSKYSHGEYKSIINSTTPSSHSKDHRGHRHAPQKGPNEHSALKPDKSTSGKSPKRTGRDRSLSAKSFPDGRERSHSRNSQRRTGSKSKSPISSSASPRKSSRSSSRHAQQKGSNKHSTQKSDNSTSGKSPKRTGRDRSLSAKSFPDGRERSHSRNSQRRTGSKSKSPISSNASPRKSSRSSSRQAQQKGSKKHSTQKPDNSTSGKSPKRIGRERSHSLNSQRRTGSNSKSPISSNVLRRKSSRSSSRDAIGSNATTKEVQNGDRHRSPGTPSQEQSSPQRHQQAPSRDRKSSSSTSENGRSPSPILREARRIRFRERDENSS